MSWFKIFIPNSVVKHYSEVTVAQLRELDCELFLVDVDNTLAPYDVPRASKENIEYLKRLKDSGFKLALVSNNNKKRVEEFAKGLDIKYYAMALKPLPFVYKKVMKDFGVAKENLVCLGDQLLTDVLGAHLAGVKVIWTKPLVNRDIFYTKINRTFEQNILNTLKKKGYVNEDV